MKSRLPLVLGLALACAAANAASPVGKWTGKVSLTKVPQLPPNATPQQRAFVQQMVASVSKIRLMLTLNADKTYVMTSVGGPAQMPQTPHRGTWSQKGNVVMAKSSTEKTPAQSLTLSADGKTMTLNAPNGQGKVVFTR